MKNLQTIRTKLEISRENLAKKAGVALSKIYLYEHGKGNPTTKTLAKIAKALDCDIKDLL